VDGAAFVKKVEPIKDPKTIKNIRTILKSQSPRNELLFILGINIGLRISDILRLKMEDLLKPNGKISKEYVTMQEACASVSCNYNVDDQNGQFSTQQFAPLKNTLFPKKQGKRITYFSFKFFLIVVPDTIYHNTIFAQ
jgi:integrase